MEQEYGQGEVTFYGDCVRALVLHVSGYTSAVMVEEDATPKWYALGAWKSSVAAVNLPEYLSTGLTMVANNSRSGLGKGV